MFTKSRIIAKFYSSTTQILKVLIILNSLLLGLQGCGGNSSYNSGSKPSANISSSHSYNAASSHADDSQEPRSIIQYNTIASAALKMAMGYAIYLPPDYNPNLRYPVLYIMYGYGGNQYSMFNNFLSLNRTADNMIAQGTMKPMIMVVPDYKNSFAVNSTREQNPDSGGGTIGLYEDYLIDELIPHIDQQFSTDTSREARFIEGYSMGGFAALYLGFNYPDLFSKIGAHSAALWDYTKNDMFIGQRDWLYTTPELRARRDPFLLAESQDLRSIYIYLDVGSDDALYEVNERFYLHLLAQGIRVEWHPGSGGHNANYWSSNTENYFRFY